MAKQAAPAEPGLDTTKVYEARTYRSADRHRRYGADVRPLATVHTDTDGWVASFWERKKYEGEGWEECTRAVIRGYPWVLHRLAAGWVARQDEDEPAAPPPGPRQDDALTLPETGVFLRRADIRAVDLNQWYTPLGGGYEACAHLHIAGDLAIRSNKARAFMIVTGGDLALLRAFLGLPPTETPAATAVALT